MDRQIGEYKYRWIDRWIDRQVNINKDGLDRQMDGQIGEYK